MRPSALLVIALSLTACKAKPPDSLADVARKLDFTMTPLLPAPASGTYYPADEEPRDYLVRKLLQGKRHDAALSGAGAGLALSIVEGKGALSRWELRESLWRAGWPYNAFDARLWNTSEGQAPPSDLLRWIEGVPDDQPVGLVRARGRDSDAWIGIRANPLVILDPIPRRTTTGQTLRLPRVEGATYVVSDATGELITGSLDEPAELLLATSGEWLVQVRRSKQELAHFPIYVGITPPEEPVLRPPGDPPVIADAEVADGWARTLLGHIRDVYGLQRWLDTPLLDAAARAVAEGESTDAIKAVGLGDEEMVVWRCDDVTVENCLDTWIWDPRRRKALLSEDLDTFGLNTRIDARGMHMTLVLVDAD